MNRSSLFYGITALAVLASIAIVIQKKIPSDEMHLLLTKGVVPASLIQPQKKRVVPMPKSNDELLGSGESAVSAPVVTTDEELVKVLSTLPRLDEIPWEGFEIASALSQTSQTCRLLPPDTPTEQFLAEELGTSDKLVTKRSTAFLISLKIDPRARTSLPSVSRATIENYLAQHGLAIQPEICRNHDGSFLLTGAVSAAFYAKNLPSLTGHPEPMIADAVRNFRVLGVLPPDQAAQPASQMTTSPEPIRTVDAFDSFKLDGKNPSRAFPGDPVGPPADAIPKESMPQDVLLPKTLVMAFSYARERIASTNVRVSAALEHELIFLHLLPPRNNSKEPELIVFTTTEGRTVFQELDLKNQTPSRSDAAVVASIRFDDFKLMGLYPDKPVVTGLSNKVRSSISVQEVRNRLQGQNGKPPISMAQLLEELHNEQGNLRSASPLFRR